MFLLVAFFPSSSSSSLLSRLWPSLTIETKKNFHFFYPCRRFSLSCRTRRMRARGFSPFSLSLSVSVSLLMLSVYFCVIFSDDADSSIFTLNYCLDALSQRRKKKMSFEVRARNERASERTNESTMIIYFASLPLKTLDRSGLIVSHSPSLELLHRIDVQIIIFIRFPFISIEKDNKSN